MKRVLKIGGIVIVLFIGFLFWYKFTYSMEVIEGEIVNDYGSKNKLLIASQGSEYKNAIVNGVIDEFKDKDVYIKVIDVTTIKDVEVDVWDAYLILHTFEIWQPQADAADFLETHYDKEKMVVLGTSGSGEVKMEGIDGYTGASIMENISNEISIINADLKKILEL